MEPSDLTEAFCHTVKVASLVPIDCNSDKCRSKLQELYLLLRHVLSYSNMLDWFSSYAIQV